MTTAAARTKRGADLRVGDVIEVWWGHSHRDVITDLQPYTGPLAYLFPNGAQLADFALLRTGMTIDNDDDFTVFASMKGER